MKKCARCQELKPVCDFYKSATGEGSRPYCKQCMSSDNKRVYETNKILPKNPPVEKKCSRCGLIKQRDNFYVDNSRKTGISHRCKECADAAITLSVQRLPERLDTSAPEKVCTSCGIIKQRKSFRRLKTSSDGLSFRCSDCIAEYERNRNEKVSSLDVREKTCLNCGVTKDKADFRKDYKGIGGVSATCRLCARKAASVRRREKLHIRLSDALRSRLRSAIKGKAKSGSAVRDLGCTVEELVKHIESMFDAKMTWDNYGHSGWHLDHVIPLSNFDLSNREQLLNACHYTNIQPLWAADNYKKGNKLPCHY